MTAIKPSMVYDLSIAMLLGNEVLQSVENCFSVADWWGQYIGNFDSTLEASCFVFRFLLVVAVNVLCFVESRCHAKEEIVFGQKYCIVKRNKAIWCIEF